MRSHARVAGTAAMVLAGLMLLGSASGSLIEDSSGGLITYQFDGNTFHDAPDTCEGTDEDHFMDVGNRTDGMLIPFDDEADHFLFDIDSSDVGKSILVDAILAQVEYEIRLDVLVPGCTGSVLDPENQPAPPIQDPVPGEGQMLATAKNTDGGYTCSDRWFFNLNQIADGSVPGSIHVTWTDGSQEDIALMQQTPATVVHYATTAHPDFTVERATAVVDGDWGGQLILSEGFCDAEDGGAVFGDPAQRYGETALEFTPITAGPHVVSVVYLPPEAPTVSTTVPASCHYCVDGAEILVVPLTYDTGSTFT